MNKKELSMNDDNIVRIDHESAASRIKEIRSMAQVRVFSEAELKKKKIIYAGMDDKKLLNVYRDIRTKLLRMTSGNNFILMVSSVCEGGGASFNAINIATVFAMDESKTSVLIDCNLRNPTVGRMIDSKTQLGLSDYLINEKIDEEEIIYACGIPRVRVVPGGSFTESGAEYFSSDRMKRFVATIKKRYPDRFIVIDSPALPDHAEARILSELSDCVLIVVPYGKVTAQQIKVAKDSVDEDKLAGFLFNN